MYMMIPINPVDLLCLNSFKFILLFPTAINGKKVKWPIEPFKALPDDHRSIYSCESITHQYYKGGKTNLTYQTQMLTVFCKLNVLR